MEIIGCSRHASKMRSFYKKATETDTILIGGETGTGKLFFARQLSQKWGKKALSGFNYIESAEDLNEHMIKEKNSNFFFTENRELFDMAKKCCPEIKEIWLKPLRERIQDIPLFIDSFASGDVATFWKKSDKVRILLKYWWPFNVAELKKVVSSKEGLKLLPYYRENAKNIISSYSITKIISMRMDSFWSEMENEENSDKFFHFFTDSIEKEFIKSALKKCNGERKKTAELLSIHRNTLIQKMNKHSIK